MLKLLSNLFAHQDAATPETESALVSSLIPVAGSLVGGPVAPLLTNLFAALFVHNTAPNAISHAAVATQALAHLPQLLVAAGVPVTPK